MAIRDPSRPGAERFRVLARPTRGFPPSTREGDEHAAVDRVRRRIPGVARRGAAPPRPYPDALGAAPARLAQHPLGDLADHLALDAIVAVVSHGLAGRSLARAAFGRDEFLAGRRGEPLDYARNDAGRTRAAAVLLVMHDQDRHRDPLERQLGYD